MTPPRLKRLVTDKQTLALINRIVSLTGRPVGIQDLSGWRLPGGTFQEAARYPVEFQGQLLGWVTGGGETAAIVAALLTNLAERESERKDLAREVLNRYREMNLLYKLPEKLGTYLEVAPVARLIMDEASQLIMATGGTMLRLNEHSGLLETAATFGRGYDPAARFRLGEGFIGGLVMAELPQILNRIPYNPLTGDGGPDLHSVICVPLKNGERIIGAMILSSDQPVEYTAADLKLFSLLASQAAPALERAAMYERLEEMVAQRTEELRYHTLQLETSIAVSRGITSILDLDTLLHQVSELIRARFSFDYVGVFLLDESGDYVQARAGTGQAGETFRQVGYRLKVGQEGIIGWVAGAGHPALVNDTSRDERYVTAAPTSSTRSELSLPLKTPQALLGVLDIQSNRLNAFSPEDVPLFQSLADQVAIAIDNARLFQASVAKQGKLEAIIEASRDGLILVDADLRLPVINQLALDLLSLPGRPADWVNRSFWEIIVQLRLHAAEAAQAALDELRNTPPGDETLRQGECPVLERTVRWLSLPVFNGVANVGRLIVLHDVTEERLLARLRTDLTQTLVHDLRSPLNNIISSLYLLQSERELAADDRQLTQQIATTSAERMLKLVNNILDVGRLESRRPSLQCQPLELAGLFSGVIQAQSLLACLKYISFETDIPANFPRAWVDSYLIERVLHNLIDNAIKFSPPQGRVLLRASLGAPAGSGLVFEQTVLLPRLYISVIDSGPGIPSELRGRLFQKFVTGAQPGRGTGLGLAFCKLAVDAHGGQIWAESEPDQGTAVTFSLPEAPQ